ncbi:hypothetical protein [Cupriavidus campinensis]|uniref:Uncharacterized protein n=1 Tax=Cupriavidus campinensis TaxID=151783 RepID=A0ABY3EGF2_9BURK|nr:hypothetical protein [Cupriavidus campinensis]TSP09911.1 hypothetical protein FGG12_25645 [Cupriavidus campinensis]
MENEIRNNHFLRRDLEDLVRERFGYRLLGKTPTPRQIIELLDLEGTARRIDMRRARLLFDGRAALDRKREWQAVVRHIGEIRIQYQGVPGGRV